MADGGLSMNTCKALTFALLIAVLTGWPGGQSESDTVTIGFTGPLSGGAALYGRNVLDALELAIGDINAAGGVTVGGRQVKCAVAPVDGRYLANETAGNP